MEAIVHPDEMLRYVHPDECRLSYNSLLKFFPGFSPAEDLVHDTIELLTFGMVPV